MKVEVKLLNAIGFNQTLSMHLIVGSTFLFTSKDIYFFGRPTFDEECLDVGYFMDRTQINCSKYCIYYECLIMK